MPQGAPRRDEESVPSVVRSRRSQQPHEADRLIGHKVSVQPTIQVQGSSPTDVGWLSLNVHHAARDTNALRLE
jgi:hypothetical protein